MTTSSPQNEQNEGEWKLITKYDLTEYACGVAAGDRVRLRRDLVVRDHTDAPTGEVHSAGEQWVVLRGVASEPETIWLREPNGDPHTWDLASFWDWFDRAGDGT